MIFREDTFDSIQQDLLSQMEQLTALRKDTEQLSKTIATNEHELSGAKDNISEIRDLLIMNYLKTCMT